MKRANKHQTAKIAFAPLNGGINVSVPPQQIAQNEMQVCQNFTYDYGTLVGRGGLNRVYTFAYDIRSMYYDVDMNCTFVFLKNRDCYMVVASSTGTPQVSYLDKVTGDKKPCCVKFQDKLFIASGGLLQYYNYNNATNDYDVASTILQTITSSYVCDRLFYRWGRLACCISGVNAADSDYIHYSSVGDATSDVAWVEDSNDASTAKFLEVGYGDSGDIIEVVPLATDIMVFKSNGKAYQIIGDNDFDSVSIVSISSYTDITNEFDNGICACNIGNEVVFLSVRGLKTLTATQDYGNISATDIGNKFNPLIVNSLHEPEMFNLPRHKMIVIRPTDSKKYFVVYNYSLNAATTWKFNVDVECFCETIDDLWVGAGANMYALDDTSTTDDGVNIAYELSPRDVASNEKVLVKAIDTKFISDHSGTATVKVGTRLSVNMPTNERFKIICNHSTDLLHIEVSSNDRFYVDHITLDVADL